MDYVEDMVRYKDDPVAPAKSGCKSRGGFRRSIFLRSQQCIRMERPPAPCGYADAERVGDIALTQLADMINRNCEHHRFGRGK